MTSNPNHVPAAFRRDVPQRPSFVGMEDDRVLRIAAAAFQSAQNSPVGSEARRDQWRRFDAAMGELGSRAITHALEKIHDHEMEEDSIPGEVMEDE